ncbi:MAG TPA: penicillin-binding protein 1C [Verrucomicrobiae bacterium]
MFGLKPKRWLGIFAAALVGIGLVYCVGLWALRFVPLPPGLFSPPASEVEFLDRNGQPLRIVRPGDLPFGRSINYADIPQPLVEATLAAEDRRFWNHHGVDACATLRAAGQWLWYGRVISGGSTISQQLIKLAQPRPRTVRTKLVEALQALRLEKVWSKQRILAEYLNRLDYGNFNRGPAAAAQFYFATPLRDLSPAECAFLAAIPQAPSRLNPVTHFDRAHKRQQWILGQMLAAHWLTDEAFRRGAVEPLVLAKPRRVFAAPHFIDLLMTLHGTQLLNSASGHPVQTSVHLELNRFAEQILQSHLNGLQSQHVTDGAIVVLDNRTGEVLSLVGSGDYFSTAAGQVNGVWAPRSPGSALKPFTYLLAFEQGATPATVVADVPTEFATATGLFAPVNYNRHAYGPMRYRLALANSLNISAIKVLASIGGPEPLERLLQQCGLSTLRQSPEEYGLGLTIGNADVRLLELANAYATLARLGTYEPFKLLQPSSAASPAPLRVADAGAAYLLADVLADNDARSLAFGPESPLRFAFPVACKTGTSSDFRDNWAFGYTPEFTVGVWVGNADSSPMHEVSGVTGAAPILHDLFEHLHERYGTTWYSAPTNLVMCWIDPVTGKRLAEQDAAPTDDAIKEKFLAENLPPLASPDDYENGNQCRAVRLGSEYREWFLTGDNWLGNRAVLTATTNSLKILFPPPGTTVYLDADLPKHGRRMTLNVSGPDNLEWNSGTLQLISEGGKEIAMLAAGRHQISVRDPASGIEASTWINVLNR